MMRRGLILISLLALGGCSSRVEPEELQGSYEFALDGLRQVVVISGGGRYTNTLYNEGAPVWSDQRLWMYEGNRNGVTFTDFRFGIPGHSPLPALWFVVPRKRLNGAKELCFDADLGRCFSTK